MTNAQPFRNLHEVLSCEALAVGVRATDGLMRERRLHPAPGDDARGRVEHESRLGRPTPSRSAQPRSRLGTPARAGEERSTLDGSPLGKAEGRWQAPDEEAASPTPETAEPALGRGPEYDHGGESNEDRVAMRRVDELRTPSHLNPTRSASRARRAALAPGRRGSRTAAGQSPKRRRNARERGGTPRPSRSGDARLASRLHPC